MSAREETITFVGPDQIQFHLDGLWGVPTIGVGIYREGEFWRVADVWFNGGTPQDPLAYGWIIKVVRAEASDHPHIDYASSYYEQAVSLEVEAEALTELDASRLKPLPHDGSIRDSGSQVSLVEVLAKPGPATLISRTSSARRPA